MRTLIVDNIIHHRRLRIGEWVRDLLLPVPAAIHQGGDHPLPARDSFDRLIALGSEASCTADDDWIVAQTDFLRAAIADGKPVFGVCFGHQLLARALFGKRVVRRAPEPELAWREIELDNADELFAGLPERATLFCSHYDEVVEPPPELRVLARSAICPVHAVRYRDRPVWGVQFHAELDDWRAAALLDARRRDPPWAPHPLDRAPVPTADFARRMLANFCAAKE